jgi:tRNA-binding protein
MIAWEDFAKLDIRVGRIVGVKSLPNPRYTTHALTVDFGEDLGKKISGARLVRYGEQELLGRLILGVVNLPPKRIGGLVSEFLTLGVPGLDGECVLVSPEREDAPLGGKLY